MSEHGCERGATELRPPPEHADKSLHWIATGKEATVGRWFPAVSEWQLLDGGSRYTANQMGAIGCRYLGPAEWNPDAQRVAERMAKGARAYHALSDAHKRIAELETAIAALREQVRIMETRAYIAEGRVKELETENARLRLIADTVPQYQAAIQELRDANSFWSLPPRVHNADAPGVTRLPPSHGLSHLRISERTRCEATETAVAQLAERRALVPEVGGSIPPGGATLGPRKGEFVTCTSGHMICEVMADIEVDDLDWARKLGAWRLETPPVVGQPVPACPCGAEWVRPWPVNTLHIKGRGWV